MAALLEKLCRNPEGMRQAGEHAMDEIYLSWKSCVGLAYDRYQQLLDEKERGLLRQKTRQPSDYLVSATAHGMSEREKLRRAGAELFEDMRETAVGMMENIQEAGDAVEQMSEKMKEKMKNNVKEWMKEDLPKNADLFLEKIRNGMSGSAKPSSEEEHEQKETV